MTRLGQPGRCEFEEEWIGNPEGHFFYRGPGNNLVERCKLQYDARVTVGGKDVWQLDMKMHDLVEWAEDRMKKLHIVDGRTENLDSKCGWSKSGKEYSWHLSTWDQEVTHDGEKTRLSPVQAWAYFCAS